MEWRTLQLAVLFLFLGNVLSLPLQILLVMTLGAIAVTASLMRGTKTTESRSSSWAASSDLAGYKHDVFLSFRGPDTRRNFTDVLHKSLTYAGIRVYLDNDQLPVGEPIKPELIEAIKQSEILIPIISEDYASSKSCLMELVQILDCKKTMNRKIIPVFFEIELSDVKKQRNSFAESFRNHERNGTDSKTIEEWKLALKEIGSLRGYETLKIKNGLYSEIMDEIIPFVRQTLKKRLLPRRELLVGVDHHVQRIMRKLGVMHRDGQECGICSSDVRVLGIDGIGGVGKTIIAEVVYYQLYGCFQGCSYLKFSNICQDDKTLYLQNKLISDLQNKPATHRCSHDAKTVLAEGFREKQVLILLDGVDDAEQLHLVVEELHWFGQGSRIIVTSRKSDILSKFKNAETYKVTYTVEPMEEEKALQLFSKHAFGRDSPENGFEGLSRKIVKAAGLLPSAIVLIGPCLFKQPKPAWKEMLKKLRDAPFGNVEHVLKISYDGLDEYAKQIFLDIACLLTGKDHRIAYYMWKDCNLYPVLGMNNLKVRSLVKIGENDELLMYDPLKTLGRRIVLNEDRIPCNRSRLWVHDEALSTLRKEEGTEKVEALRLTIKEGSDKYFKPAEFAPLSKLRFLELDRAIMRGDFTGVFLQLRWLQWERCHNSSENLLLGLEKLAILDLSRSAVANDWEGWTQIMQKSKKLKVLELTGCSRLHKTPCFPADTKIKRLILERCSYLSVIDKSIGNLKYLKSLNIKSTLIFGLPEEINSLDNLEELLIDKTSISHLHFLRGSMRKLKMLSASSCKNLAEISECTGCLDESIIPGLPNSVELLEGLAELSLRDCWQLTALPDSDGMLKSLQKMDLSNTSIKALPESIRNLDKLEVLRMNNTPISTFPKDIANLGKLQVITFSHCQSMNGDILCNISGLSSLRILELSFTLISSLPESICQLSHLQTLRLLGCDELRDLPTLPSSLVSLRWGTKNMGEVQDFSYLRDLKVLELVNDPSEDMTSFELSHTESTDWISSVSNLETLKLYLPNVTSLPKDFNALTQLKKLDLSCINLQDLPQLPSSLSKLLIENCKSQSLDLSNLGTLSELELCVCNASEILGLGKLRLLQVLKISDCKIKNLDGLEQASQLRKFSMSQCYSLDRLPDISKCQNLEFKEIVFCNIGDLPC